VLEPRRPRSHCTIRRPEHFILGVQSVWSWCRLSLCAGHGISPQSSDANGPSRHDKPTWYIVSKQDRMIAPAGERAMAHAIGTHALEVDASHAFVDGIWALFRETDSHSSRRTRDDRGRARPWQP
jgi:hypothetical protein